MPLFPRSVDSTRTYSAGVKAFAVPVPTNEKLKRMLLYNLHKSSVKSARYPNVIIQSSNTSKQTREIKTMEIYIYIFLIHLL